MGPLQSRQERRPRSFTSPVNSRVYRGALSDYQSLVKLAGILAHERWHLQHGPDEIAAYEIQLAIMTYTSARTRQTG